MIRFMQLLLVCCLALPAFAQDAQVAVYPDPTKVTGKEVQARKSPMAVTSLKTDEGYMKIVYSQPHLRGRQMVGKEVPYGQVWRVGANEATELFATAEFEIAGMDVKPGAYSVFAIPNQDKWTLILNKSLGQWGAYSYDEKMDVARAEAQVQKADKTYEAFTMWFGADGKSLNLAWGDSMVSFPVETDD